MKMRAQNAAANVQHKQPSEPTMATATCDEVFRNELTVQSTVSPQEVDRGVAPERPQVWRKGRRRFRMGPVSDENR